MARDAVMHLSLDEVVVPSGRRPLDAATIKQLSLSIEQIGLQHPITVRSSGGVFTLIAGHHRLEAVRLLGEESIIATVTKLSDREARKWEIAENLHRSDLTELQRKEQIAEWISLEDEELQSAQVAPIESRRDDGRGHRKESGINAASRELGVDRTEAQRAVKIASISDQAKQAAIDAHLDGNQSALLKIARAPASEQVAVVNEIVEARALKTDQDIKNRAAQEVAELLAGHIPGDAWDVLKANMQAAGNINLILSAFNNLVGNSIMDRRHG